MMLFSSVILHCELNFIKQKFIGVVNLSVTYFLLDTSRFYHQYKIYIVCPSAFWYEWLQTCPDM